MATYTPQELSPFKMQASHIGSFVATTGTSTTISNVSIAQTLCYVFYQAKNVTGITLLANTATTRTVVTANVSKAGNSFKVRHKAGVASTKLQYVIFYG